MVNSKCFRLVFCPRYLRIGQEHREYENLLAQRSLWSAVKFLLIGQEQLRMELRFVSDSKNLSISPFLILSSMNGNTELTSFNTIERLLPEEYGWLPVGEKDIKIPFNAGVDGAQPWFVSLVRRLEFFNLPAAFPWDIMGGNDEGGQGRVSVPQEERVFPTPGVPMKKQLMAHSLCLPLLGELKDETRDRRRFCLEMQHAAPAILSIVLKPVPLKILEEDRSSATFLGRCLDPFRGGMVYAGFSSLDKLRSVYDRYWLPSNYLCKLSMRIVAVDQVRTMAVAHSLCSLFGGMRAFEIKPSKISSEQELNEIFALGCEMVPEDQAQDNRNKKLAELQRLLKKLNVNCPEYFEKFVQRMPHIYTLDEAESILRLPYGIDGGLPGIESRMVQPFYPLVINYQPFDSKPPSDRIRLGLVSTSPILEKTMSGGSITNPDFKSAHWHTIPAADLCKHALIVGSTGSGKTVTTQFILRELARVGIPFLVIEPVKTEYYDKLKNDIPNIKRYRFEGDASGNPASDYLAFDPLRLQEGVTVARHISYIKSCFEAAFPMAPWMSLILENGLYAYYGSLKNTNGNFLKTFSRGNKYCHVLKEKILKDQSDLKVKYVQPSFRNFKDYFLERYLPKELDPKKSDSNSKNIEFLIMTQLLFKRRFENLWLGPLGKAFDKADNLLLDNLNNFNMFEILINDKESKGVILELDGIPDNEQKALVMAFLLTFLFEYRQAEDMKIREQGRPDQKPPISHVLIIEEAHRLLSNDKKSPTNVYGGTDDMSGPSASGKSVSLFTDMLSEVRAFGQGIVIVEQIPTKLVPEAVKNTNLKLMLRLNSHDDRNYLGYTMNFNDEQQAFVTNLRPGQMIAFEENVDDPIYLTIPAEHIWKQQKLFSK